MGTRNGEQLTYVKPASLLKNSTERGSPPCSPQTPIFSEGLTALPFSTVILINEPTPLGGERGWC